MSITQVGSVTSFAMTAGATSANISVPAGVVNGNALYLVVWGDDASATISQASFTAVGAQLTGSASGRGQVFARVAASEPASYVVTLTSNKYCGLMVALAGVDTSVGTLGIRTSSPASLGTGTARTTPTITPTNGDWLLAFFGDRSTSTGTTGWTPTAPAVELADVNNAGAASSPRASLEAVWSNGSVAGSATSYTSTANASQANAFAWIATLAPTGVTGLPVRRRRFAARTPVSQRAGFTN